MSAAIGPNPQADCQGCGASALHTPIEVVNRPGLSALAYRIGTHQPFKDTMLAGLGSVAGLQTRRDDDFSIALLDAWATVADTLTFYQERIANEAYLSTATERRSLLELGRLIDYKARPGVAASSYLAFTIEDAPGAPELAAKPVTIGGGLKVQSIPTQGGLPQTFETVDEIEARPEWNAIQPQLTQPQPITASMQSITVKGTNTDVQPGDSILIVAGEDDEDRVVMQVMKVTAQSSTGTSRIDLAFDPPDPPRPVLPRYPFRVFFPRPSRLTSSFVASNILGFTWRQADLSALATVQKWSARALMRNIRWQVAHRFFRPETGVFSFRDRGAIFGHNAPRQRDAAAGVSEIVGLNDSRTLRDEADKNQARAIDLDRTYPAVLPGSWLVLESPTDRIIYRVENSVEISRADFGLSAKATRLRLSSDTHFDSFTVRETTVFARSNGLDLADLPIVDDVEGDRVTLDNVYLGLQVGKKIIVSGMCSDLGGVMENEVMTLAEVNFTAGYTTLVFQQALTHSYLRDTVNINANVVLATHGETVEETLGGGNASEAHQRFALRQQPLTYVSSDAPSGGESTLQLRVNDLFWHEAPSFFGRTPQERVFVTHTDDDGTTSVLFGDGANGARAATGFDNIRATYRKGIGALGNVDANQLTLLSTRPQGVRSVTNPLQASGGADPEAADGIRRNAPLTILTMDRIVSLQDYEDFAHAFAGVAKALATTWAWNGHARGVFITIAGPDGAAIDLDSRTYANLLAAIEKAGAPHVPLRVQSYRKAFFRLIATVTVKPGFQKERVVAAVEAALRSRFSFDARAFGQSVTLSEVVAVMQAVPGVLAVDVDHLGRTDGIQDNGLVQPLSAASPQMADDATLLAAELLILDPRPVDLKGGMP